MLERRLIIHLIKSLSQILQGLSSIAINSIVLVTLCYGGYLISLGELTKGNEYNDNHLIIEQYKHLGQLTSFMLHSMVLQSSLSQLSILFGEVNRALGSTTRITKLLKV